jgi:hypothetical protein
MELIAPPASAYKPPKFAAYNPDIQFAVLPARLRASSIGLPPLAESNSQNPTRWQPWRAGGMAWQKA